MHSPQFNSTFRSRLLTHCSPLCQLQASQEAQVETSPKEDFRSSLLHIRPRIRHDLILQRLGDALYADRTCRAHGEKEGFFVYSIVFGAVPNHQVRRVAWRPVLSIQSLTIFSVRISIAVCAAAGASATSASVCHPYEKIPCCVLNAMYSF